MTIKLFRAIYMAPHPEWNEFATIEELAIETPDDAIHYLQSAIEHDEGGEAGVTWNHFKESATAAVWLRAMIIDPDIDIHTFHRIPQEVK